MLSSLGEEPRYTKKKKKKQKHEKGKRERSNRGEGLRERERENRLRSLDHINKDKPNEFETQKANASD